MGVIRVELRVDGDLVAAQNLSGLSLTSLLTYHHHAIRLVPAPPLNRNAQVVVSLIDLIDHIRPRQYSRERGDK